jgi:radical SAM-linked protein
MQRLRVKYKKEVELQYTGNLDLLRVWERTFRRAKIPIAYSQGFHPQPKIHQACALPLGFTSQAEILDFWCDAEISVQEIANRLKNTVQPGIKIMDIEPIPLVSPVLQTIVEASGYRVVLPVEIDLAQLENKVSALLSAAYCERERRGKPYDLRPLIKSLEIIHSNPPEIRMRLLVLPGATGRPEEILDVLGFPPFSLDVERTELTFMSSPA